MSTHFFFYNLQHLQGNSIQFAITTATDFSFFQSEVEIEMLIDFLTRNGQGLRLEVSYLLLLDYDPAAIQAFFERLSTLQALTRFYIFVPSHVADNHLLEHITNQNTQIIINGLAQLRQQQINVEIDSRLVFLQENEATPPSSPSPALDN